MDRPPLVVDYMINSRCNLSCPFCYGPDPADDRSIRFDQIESLIEFVHGMGVAGFNVSGGEPTLSPVLENTLRAIHLRGMWTALQTNGTRPKIVKLVLPYLRWLGLPLDAVESSIGLQLRTSRNHDQTTVRLARSDEVTAARSAGLKLKIGTVLTRLNVHHLRDIAETVAELQVDSWKVHQFRPRGQGYLNQAQLSLTTEEFQEAVSALASEFADISFTPSGVRQSKGAYLIVNPDSTLLIPQDDHYQSYGPLLGADGRPNRNVWWSAVHDLNPDAHVANVRDAFPDNNLRSAPADGPGGMLAVEAGDRIVPRVIVDRDGR